MPKSANQKLKILYILRYLQKNSHERHLVGTQELIDMLNQQNISCDRKTIYADIEALQEFGYEIESVPGRNGGYRLSEGTLELSELKLLIDAVQSSKYLTEDKSRDLIERICNLCNEHDAGLLKRTVLVAGRVKSMNKSVLYTVDSIQEAILQNRQITFRYFDWSIQGKRLYRERDYVASPYGLIQDNENCYLLAYSERHGVTHYRVDRMDNVRILEEKRIPCPELSGQALNEHAKRQFQMFSGEEETVRMRFSRKLTNVVFDRFGTDTMLIPDGDDHFICTVSVAVSPMFLSWVIGFGKDAQILFPQSVQDRCREMCQDVASLYAPNPKD